MIKKNSKTSIKINRNSHALSTFIGIQEAFVGIPREIYTVIRVNLPFIEAFDTGPVFKREFDYALSFNNMAHVPPSQCQYFVLQFQMNIVIYNNRFFLEKLTFFESVVFVRLSISICTTAVDDVAFFDDNYSLHYTARDTVHCQRNNEVMSIVR